MISYGEKLCREFLSMWFPAKTVLYNYRPIWLKNPDTGRNLELDIYYPDLKLAVEFHGIQHKLIFQARKDWFKQNECRKIGILMISVYNPIDLFKCKKLIMRHTGIKPITGKQIGDEFLSKLRTYSPCIKGSCSWYNQEKIDESTVEKDRVRKEKGFRKWKRRQNRNKLIAE